MSRFLERSSCPFEPKQLSEEAHLMEVRVLGDDRESMLTGVAPEFLVATRRQADFRDVARAWEFSDER